MSRGLDRRTFAWCAVAVAAALLPLAQGLSAELIALLALLALTGFGFGWRYRVLHAALRLPLTLLVGGMVLYSYGLNFGRDSGAALLVTMLALKLMETRRIRDARSVLGFALFAIMAGFLQDQSPSTLWLALLATGLTLSALAIVAEFESPGFDPSRAAKVPAVLTANLRLLALSLPLAIAGFLLFPRLANPLWAMPGNVKEARTGLSDEMAPGDIALLYADDSPVLRVTFEGSQPPQEAMYWRGPVLVNFDGRRWTREAQGRGLEPAPLEALGAPISYEVMQEPTDRRYLMTLDVPIAAPPGSRLGFDRMASTLRPRTEVVRYRATSYVDYRLEPQLRPTYRRWSTALPDGYNPRTEALVAGWIATGADTQALIRRALALFQAEFSYTLRPMPLGRDSVDDFLFNTKQGYCEHFSSAFVVMMRFAGIPARVVTGYQGGQQNDVGNYWVVRQSDAHAWAEVWLDGRGWVRIDPTSSVAPERIQRGSDSLIPASAWSRFARPMLEFTDMLRRGWNDLVLGFNAATQRQMLRPFGIEHATTMQLGFALATGLGLALLITLVLLLRGPRAPHDPLRVAYARFLQHLVRVGIVKPPHEGPLDFAQRVAGLLPDSGNTVLALSRRYALRRYGRTPPDPNEDAALCADLRRFRVLEKTATRWRRNA